nr:calpain-B-like isoform X10 [Biomphalaria glabrata]
MSRQGNISGRSSRVDKKDPLFSMKLQQYADIKAQCLKTKSLFEDPEFVCCDSSIMYSKKVDKKYEWKRPSVKLLTEPETFEFYFSGTELLTEPETFKFYFSTRSRDEFFRSRADFNDACDLKLTLEDVQYIKENKDAMIAVLSLPKAIFLGENSVENLD